MRRLWLITKWTVASVAALIGIAVLSVSFILRGEDRSSHPMLPVTADKILAGVDGGPGAARVAGQGSRIGRLDAT